MERLYKIFSQDARLQSIIKNLKNGIKHIGIKKTIHSYFGFWIDQIAKQTLGNILIILNDKEDAAYFYEDLKNISQNNVFFYPSSLKFSLVGSQRKISAPNIMMRSEVLRFLAQQSQQMIIVSYSEAIAEKTIEQSALKSREFKISVSDNIDSEFLEEWLIEEGFNKVQFVYEPGQFARRGNIIDIFSFATDYPYRIYFFGDEVEKIKSFNIENQLTIKELKYIHILPNISISERQQTVAFLKNLPKNTILWSFDLKTIFQEIDLIYQQTPEIEVHTDFDTIKIEFSSPTELFNYVEQFQNIEVSNTYFFEPLKKFEVKIKPQPIFQKNFKLLSDYMEQLNKKGYLLYVLSKNKKQIQRLKDIFTSSEINKQIDFQHINTIIKEGFIDEENKIALFTEHQIFNRFHRYYLKEYWHKKSKNIQLIKEINDLKPGDYVVHTDFGIGIFRGLKTIENNGKKIEVIQIDYKGSDKLYVNVHSLYKISKYKGNEGEPPTIHSLNSRIWKNIKSKAKKRVKDIAKELISLYAQRMNSKGYAFSPDNYLQEALEASFIFDETPDQAQAIEQVKKDMEKPVPMDRLICGDVGFGKTEVAVRAAFKAVLDGKQVALLCPTTVLTYQHYKTFKERLKDFAVEIDFISRLKTPAQQRQTLKKLADGKIDIIIGTHRLVSPDVKFKDLGLLIIDEEQRFGVAVKEKLRQLKVNIDTLTLTATPIPRTLQFSLMGARDLSIINTPPPNRRPIITELHTFNAEIIKKAIEYELNRDGQVFFVHNNIASLNSLEAYLNKIIPNIKTAIAHGQMKPKELEQIMTDFINGKYNVLITTTIIENGLDIPNVNTIIINNAHKFGLSQLHQLRGRVGRSDKQAFCYLLSPPINSLNTNAKRRLQTIETFTEIGSGFNIALQDLDIRGAGNLIGAEQSGFINDIGIETFKQILQEAIHELKLEQIKKDNKQKDENIQYITDCQVSTDLDAKIPAWYIEDVAERLFFYRKINTATNQKDIDNLIEQLQDRFGSIPTEVQQLFDIIKLRKIAVKLAIEKIILKDGKMIAYFVSDAKSPFYDSVLFKEKILRFISQQSQILLKYRNNRVYLYIEKVFSISDAIKHIKKIKDFVSE